MAISIAGFFGVSTDELLDDEGVFHFGGKSKMEAKTQTTCFSLAVLATRACILQDDFGQNCEGAFKLGIKLALRPGLLVTPSFAPNLKHAR